MARIWILGDSWGTLNGLPPIMRPRQKHLHQCLVEAGHRVVNLSIPGGSNGQSINLAYKHMRKCRAKRRPHTVDYLIWFHTESLRERSPTLTETPYTIQDLTRQQATLTYRLWKSLVEQTGARDIIIGGQAPVITDLLVHEPYHLIEDWRCELLGIPSIMTHSVCHTDLFEHPNCKDPAKIRLDMLAQNEVIIDMERESDLFPDNAHPGRKAHESLFKRISNLLC
jgi:hypothetical protein